MYLFGNQLLSKNHNTIVGPCINCQDPKLIKETYYSL